MSSFNCLPTLDESTNIIPDSKFSTHTSSSCIPLKAKLIKLNVEQLGELQRKNNLTFNSKKWHI